ncbi:hypothetical protein ATO9_12005 [Pseudooceanicola atlanticus]|uniref:Uncharacterized protein n=1 Tax=Pseudooceanicola atlanticus TaxID=1461694 RepID=A0A0A0EDL8_9RHOB|nr:hypothetical protein ATO9_12005 [Pseudooceanicola atlanticus]
MTTRMIIAVAAAGLTLASAALANINPEPIQRPGAILTQTKQEPVEIYVSAEEVDACRATLSQVLGVPPMGQQAHLGERAAPSLPVVQCVIEAREDVADDRRVDR